VENPIISVRDLRYSYGGATEILKGISADIWAGERIAVIGTNGAGKSTFFLNLNGVLQAEAGDIYFHGEKITYSKTDLIKLRQGIGIVFQDADNQIIATTVRGEVSFGPMNLKLPKDEVVARVDKALTYMNLLDFKDRAPHYLSGGEKKRVTIADIIAMYPEVIIFDEPTAALDPVNVSALEGVLEKLSKEGKTLIISTHDLDFAYRWAERVIVFGRGEIIFDGKPEEVFQQDAILQRANLTRPIMVDIRNILIEKGILQNDSPHIKSPIELEQILHK